MASDVVEVPIEGTDAETGAVLSSVVLAPQGVLFALVPATRPAILEDAR